MRVCGVPESYYAPPKPKWPKFWEMPRIKFNILPGLMR